MRTSTGKKGEGPSLALLFRLLALLRPLVEDLQGPDPHLAAAPHAAVRGLPGRPVQPALEVDQASLLQVAAGELGQLAPGTQAVELGLLAFVGGQAQLGDRAAARRVVELGIAGQPADQGDPVERRAAGLAAALLVAVVDDLQSGLLRGIW